MNVLERITELTGWKFEDLSPDERSIAMGWVEHLAEKEITIDSVKEFVKSMRTAIENELIDTDEFIYIFIFRFVNRKHILLKARLKNLIVLEGFLEGPEKAKKALELYLKKLEKK